MLNGRMKMRWCHERAVNHSFFFFFARFRTRKKRRKQKRREKKAEAGLNSKRIIGGCDDEAVVNAEPALVTNTCACVCDYAYV